MTQLTSGKYQEMVIHVIRDFFSTQKSRVFYGHDCNMYVALFRDEGFSRLAISKWTWEKTHDLMNGVYPIALYPKIAFPRGTMMFQRVSPVKHAIVGNSGPNFSLWNTILFN